MNIPDKSLSLKYKQIRDFLGDRFKIPQMRNVNTIAEMNYILSNHHEIIVVLSHEDYNTYVVELRENENPHITTHRIGIVFTAPFIHPTSQYNYANMLACDEVIFNTTFFELTADQLLEACSINQPIDNSNVWM